MSIEDSLDIVNEAINEYFDERAYHRYCLDNVLLQFNNSAMNYLEYKKEMGLLTSSTINRNDDTSKIDKDKIRNESTQIISEIFGC